jgi:RND family efflux transporter MFP subunit
VIVPIVRPAEQSPWEIQERNRRVAILPVGRHQRLGAGHPTPLHDVERYGMSPPRQMIAGLMGLAVLGGGGILQAVLPAPASGPQPPPQAVKRSPAARPPEPTTSTTPQGRQSETGDASKTAPGGPCSVTTVQARRADFEVQTGSPCQLAVFEPVAITARIAGTIASRAVNVGDRVHAQQALAELDDAERNAEVRAAHARIDRARAQVKQAEVHLEIVQAETSNAELEGERMERLVVQRALAPREIRAVKAQVRVSQSKLEKAKADLEESLANLRVTEATSARIFAGAEHLHVVSSIEGVVIEQHATPGLLARPGDSLFVVARTDKLIAVTHVPESESLRVKVGNRALVQLNAFPNHPPIEVTVSRIAYSLDAAAHTRQVEIDVPHPDGQLRPGETGIAAITFDIHRNLVIVPASSIAEDPGPPPADFCYRVSEGQAIRTRVKLNHDCRPMRTSECAPFYEVLAGLNGGEDLASSLEWNGEIQSIAQFSNRFPAGHPPVTIGVR